MTLNSTDFASLDLNPELLKNLASLNYVEMTPIQAMSLPVILQGKDLIAQAKTGSGKTAAFGLGLLAQLDLASTQVQGLILCPTRELADQVSKALRQLARMLPNVKILTLCGGTLYKPQVKSLQHGACIVVGTLGRIAKHLRKENLKLADLKMLVLDEGDRMLDMGFHEELDAIIAELPSKRQTLLFSATYPARIQTIAERIMVDPVVTKIDSSHDESSIKQHFYKVADDEERMEALSLLLLELKPVSTVIFCNTKIEAQAVMFDLADEGFSTLALHGDLEQEDRDETLVRFANKSISILVATDVAARGLDIDAVDVVINYHVSRDFEVHTHRIGRTGRAGDSGVALSLYSKKEAHKISLLQEYLGIMIEPEALPDESVLKSEKSPAPMVTIRIKAGKKKKFRAGNILGALTGSHGLKAEQVGKIHIFDHFSYVAVRRDKVQHALQKFTDEQWKGRPIQAWVIRN